jgi:hypothetical protein
MFALVYLLVLADSALLSRRSVSAGHATASQEMAAKASIDQVIDVLKNMMKDFDKQASEDKQNWEDYSKWSDDEEKDRNSFIQEQEGVVMSSTAQLNANKQSVQTLTQQIADLTAEISETTASLQELIHLRQEEHKAHEEEVADLTHTIEAVNKATEVLEGHYAAAGSLAEIKQQVTQALSALALSRASDPKMQPVTALLQNPDWLNVDGGAAYGEYKGVAAESGGVIGTLKTIRSTLMDQKQASIEKENESRRQFEVAKGAKEDELKKSKDEKASKENTLEECKAKIEHFTSVIAQAEVDIKDAKEYVAKLLSDRALFSKEYDGRVTMRNSEQAATQAALDALQEVTAGAKSGVEGAFLQTVHKMSHRVPCPHCAAAVQKLFKVASDTKNAALVQLGSAIESNLKGTSKQPQAYFDASAMDPVKNLLHEMIVKLEDELAAETSHHEWCETEKATSAAAKLERETNIESLTAEIEALNTAIAQLTAEIAFLHSELIRIQRETDAAIQLRKEEHETFQKAKTDHDEVIAALDKAVSALSGQYGFLQVSSTEHKKQSPFAEYSSGSGAGASAMEMLQDLLNRYNEARTELIQSEEAAQKAHEDLLAKNEQFRKDTTQTKQAKETEKRQKNERLGNAKVELAANRNELAEVVQYIADLRPSCDDIRTTFEERKKRREAEIAALKETVAVLEDPSMMR